ncbi:DUF4345 family protein [Pseudoponticoccus marisrubri]|uniref:DUF4345 domain-containing protein n=1 Tax=Pseudoponticoccus marisrubri TaxID=1685382 RepID=A0A0W7WM54_9RHOB|nr:DUF4345 family protein [Pseudoponticoccus marisrubri]KUF11669.1 hypothetical protein AVJ23_07930 [Pseudoponticoccus marisrubri]
MIEITQIAIALVTIAFGLFGFVAPRYTANVLDFRIGDSSMGLSELRASAGGLFVAMGLACFVLGPPAYLMLGVAYGGAAMGRAVSMVLDQPPQPKALMWFLFEALPSAFLIAVNLGRI